MSLTIERTGTSALHGLGARALRAVAIAVLTVGLQVPALAVAGGSADSSVALAGPAPIAAAAADCADATAPFQNDDGEDHFDEGDDEFDCPDIDDRDDPCSRGRNWGRDRVVPESFVVHVPFTPLFHSP